MADIVEIKTWCVEARALLGCAGKGSVDTPAAAVSSDPLMSEAREQAVLPVFANEKGEEAIQAVKPGTTSQNMVAKRSFLLTRWKQVPGDLRLQLGTLLQAIREDFPDEDVVELGRAVEAKLGQLIGSSQSRLDAAVDTDINAGDGAYAATSAQIRALRAELASNSMVAALRDNAFTAGGAFVSAFDRALDEAEAALSA